MMFRGGFWTLGWVLATSEKGRDAPVGLFGSFFFMQLVFLGLGMVELPSRAVLFCLSLGSLGCVYQCLVYGSLACFAKLSGSIPIGIIEVVTDKSPH